MRIIDLLDKSVSLHPDRRVISQDNDDITYRALSDAVSRLAARLAAEQIAPGSRIGLLIENSLEYVAAFFAIFRAGYVAVPLDTSLTADGLKYILADCEAQVLFTSARFRRTLPRILDDDTTVRLVISNKKTGLQREDIACEILDDILRDSRYSSLNDSVAGTDDKELAAIFYTSGSTGTSKGVMLSHRNLVSNTVATVEYLELTADDSIMVILPFYYIYGNSLLLTHIACGGRIVIDNRFMYPEVILDTMEQQATTGLSGVPSNFMILLGNSTFPKRRFPSLRYFTQAGGAMAPEVTRQLMDAFPDKQVFIMYGQTEAAPRVSWLPPDRLEEKLGSIGIPVPGVDISIIGDNGEQVPPGDVGEIVVSGPNVMMGYWKQAEEEREVLKKGRLFTGDLARMDDEGFVYVVGRRKEIIKVGGNRVSVKEIEERVLEHEAILEVAVFGVDDSLLGEAIRMVIVVRPDWEVSEKEILEHCLKRLATHKVPKEVTFADSLPKLQSGKVNKLALKQQANGVQS